MTEPTAAIAVFVKTPGLSAIKTRLAEGVGPELSAVFYHRSVAAIAATVKTVAASTGVSPYWAVAEEAGLADPLWQQFPRIAQGEGDLGNRFHQVFDELQSQHTGVIVIGADSPQLTPAILGNAIELLAADPGKTSHVLGRTHDGGFYLFGSNARLTQQIWCEVPYSTEGTAEALVASLRNFGQIKELERLTDVDRAEDLPTLQRELRSITSRTPEQQNLLEWIEQYS